jgi:hypothetical protein
MKKVLVALALSAVAFGASAAYLPPFSSANLESWSCRSEGEENCPPDGPTEILPQLGSNPRRM